MSKQAPYRLPARVRWAAALIWLTAAVVVAAACSGGSAGPEVASVDSTEVASDGSTSATDAQSSETNLSPEDRRLAYAQCMREHGVTDFPDPESGGSITIDPDSNPRSRPTSPQFQAADEACKQYQPGGGEGEGPSEEVREGALRYAQCMRDNGISEFPDPSEGGGPQALDPKIIDSPQFEAANDACNHYLADQVQDTQ